MGNLLNCTCSDDICQVYMMNVGVTWEDLSDEERKVLYESESYLRRKCERNFNRLIAEKTFVLFRDGMDCDTCEILGYIRGSEKDAVRYCDECNTDCECKWEKVEYAVATNLLEENDEND